MYVFQHQKELGGLNIDEALFKGGLRAISRETIQKIKCFPSKKSVSGAQSGSPVPANSPSHVDVLFDARTARDTCLGVGEKLFAKMREKDPDIQGAFYQTGNRRVLPLSEHIGCKVITAHAKPTLSAMVRFLRLLPVAYWHGLKSADVARVLFLHPLVTTINLIKIVLMVDSIDRALEMSKPKVVISCNEQGGGDASILFALARKKGIHTVQYLHCPPTRQFVPFISDDFWGWSELTTRMLLGDAQDSRVISMGSLEHENRSEGSIQSDQPEPEERRVLFLAQMGMDEAWGIHAVVDGMKKFSEGIRLYPGAMKVRIREHPNAKQTERMMLEDAMAGISFEITAKSVLLTEDVAWATHVYAVSSNAIFAGLVGGRPSYLFWNDQLDEIYGRCFLPDECVVKSSAEFVESLDRSLLADHAEQILQDVLGPPGAMDRAVERIQQLVKIC